MSTITQVERCAVIGAGSWGTAVAQLIAESGRQVTMWSYDLEVVDSINRLRQNTLFHPGIELNQAIDCSHDLNTVLDAHELLIVAIPSQFLRSTFSRAADHLRSDHRIVSISKGIEAESLMTMSQVIHDVAPQIAKDSIAVLSGPSFSVEVIRGQPTAVALASPDRDYSLALQRFFHTPYFRTYVSDDRLGLEVGGSLKNVIAIGVGISDGLGFGYNARAGLMTRSLAEMSRLVLKLGGQAQTLSGLGGIGDLILTCTGDLSRNRSFGLRIGKGEHPNSILQDSRMVVEGVETSKSVYQLAADHGLDMPICQQVYHVVHEERSPQEAMQILLSREAKSEFLE